MISIKDHDRPFIVGLAQNSRPADWPAVEALYALDPGTLALMRQKVREEGWGHLARQGNWRALLAIYRARVLLQNNIGSERLPAPADRERTCGGCNLSVWKEARAFLLLRTHRRAAGIRGDSARSGDPGRIFRLWIQKLKARALAEGESYHREVSRLYVSERADVVYGKGGQEGRNDDAYSKAYRKNFGGAKWKNAGARLDDESKPTCVILENYRGTEVARVPLRKEN